MFARTATVLRSAVTGIRRVHTLPELPYKYEALEPIISRDIMAIHYEKHHATYVANLNKIEEELRSCLEKNNIEQVIALSNALKFNGGGHLNHSIFWQNLSPCGGEPSEPLKKAIDHAFSSVDEFKNRLAAAAIGVQGSGWAWLGWDQKDKILKIATCANQDPLQGTTGLIPIFGIDVWEHAYYLQYKNVRADYVKAIFEIANWKDMNKRFNKVSK
ncbi:superoxide dismutase [Mn] 1, mitochondrial isoform X1 [Chrysoperla carnea]|uniref:superoxide dismutase [Mn] 1, mitochondrial isoform X1 n=1 Tax=Chrysoperla carnea TaxID=189513 RepID=UPI001D0887D8|nr:superoxide dismutase [Mn] 1, mitochondrial isoform X1 [Chrysoperla carnea]